MCADLTSQKILEFLEQNGGIEKLHEIFNQKYQSGRGFENPLRSEAGEFSNNFQYYDGDDDMDTSACGARCEHDHDHELVCADSASSVVKFGASDQQLALPDLITIPRGISAIMMEMEIEMVMMIQIPNNGFIMMRRKIKMIVIIH